MTVLHSQFVKQASFEVEYAPTHITKWRSSRTGLQLTYINQPSPMVNGYFAVATEIEDNSGCPHTLEHLIFMGSKKFPYKGLLDALGNRLYSSTNAWTAVDQTVYTLTTAGWDGFKTLLPIYLEHLFHPTLTDEACLTEVYHVDGKGKEKGVVFSEMQGIESQSWFVSFKSMQETLYAPKSGYSSETGGLMAELRHLKSSQIREFHQSMYRPDNLCVVITGSIDQDELLEIMTAFDNEIPSLPATASRERPRPFVDSKHDEPLKETVLKVVEFPDKDESTGELLMSWIGCKGDNVLINTAVDMVGAYFTDSPISLFNKHLVEVEDSYAAEIAYTTDDYYRTALNFSCGGVPTEKLEELATKMKELLQLQTEPDNLNVLYMRQIINQQRLKFISQTEKSPSLFSTVAISDFIYGKDDGSDLSKWLENLNEYDTLLTWTAQQWCDVIKKYFVDNHSATIIAKPSSKVNELHKQKNKELRRSIKEKHGEAGLKILEENLDAAQKFNDRPIPEEILVAFEKPDPSKIAFIKTNSYKAGLTKGIVDLNSNQYIESGSEFCNVLREDTPADFPLFMHFESFKSQFTTIQLVMSSTRLRPELLKYMSVVEEIFSMSIQLPNGGKYIPFEQVIADLNRDLIEFQLDNGYDYQFLELISMSVKFETKNYQRAINWLYNITHFVKFEKSRIKVIIEKIINSLPDKKRNGELMMYSSEFRHLFTDRSLRKAQDAINTEDFYKHLLEEIDNDNFEKIAADLEEIKTSLFSTDNIKIIIMGNTVDLENPVSSWSNNFAQSKTPEDKLFSVQPFCDLPRSYQFKSELGQKCAYEAYLVDIPATESTHLIAVTKIPTDYLDEDIPRISLAIEFLCAVEGPFWRAIRGTGLAYGVSMKKSLEMGHLTYTIYRGSDPKQAWLSGKTIVEQYASGELEIDPIPLESAVATIVNELANSQESSFDAASFKICDNLFKRRGPNYVEVFLKQLNQLTAKDVIYVLNKYFVNLFKPEHSVLFTSLPSDEIEKMGDFFHQVGYNINVESIKGADDDCEGMSEDNSDDDEEEEDDDDDEEDDEDDEEEEEDDDEDGDDDDE
ncbi:uncharacterized protein LODBEIA_P61000 [Lodderomyces beijingensis]|uniref:Mitochondrial presequence protease n=1 Tax=Lodderomyces beijingensis TaxID=1775926 RepID=A0ABP0ZUR3_9ASCO